MSDIDDFLIGKLGGLVDNTPTVSSVTIQPKSAGSHEMPVMPSGPMESLQPANISPLDLLPETGSSPEAPPSPAPNKGPINYDNSADANAVRASVNGLPKPQGGGINPGVWGLLPEKVQHGTLRNILGALGDALLVGSGKQAVYEPRMERQQEGLAMAGYNNNPEAAIERMAATGTPGAMANSVKMQDNLNNLNLHRDQLQALQQNRDNVLAQRREAQQSAAQGRHDNIVARMTPYVGGMLSSAKNAKEYAEAYANAERMAQRIDPSYHASDFGAVEPEDWKPGTRSGMTSNQQQVSQDKAAQRDVSVANNKRTTGTSASNNMRSTGVSAGNNARSNATSTANNIRTNDRIAGGKSGGGSGLHASVTGKATAPVVTNHDVSYLKSHPEMRATFEAHFGQGSAKKYLGH